MNRLLGLACALALAACAPSAADNPAAEQWRMVMVAAEPVDLGVAEVGRLRFRGGLALSAEDAAFGGISGIEVINDGRLIAITDNGDWIEARLVLDEALTLIGVADVRIAMMRDGQGVVFPSKREGDAEALAQMRDGRFAVSFEQSHTIRIYDLNRDGPFGRARAGPRLAGAERLPSNAGIEALASTFDGELLAGAEGGGLAATPLWLAPIGQRDPVAPRIGYPAALGFSLTGLDRLPDGGFVALERFYAPVIGARARITRFPEQALNARGEALPEVEELAVLAPPLPLDNFEAIAAVRMPDGAIRIYIVSDDNFSDRQRTLIYAFDLSQGPD